MKEILNVGWNSITQCSNVDVLVGDDFVLGEESRFESEIDNEDEKDLVVEFKPQNTSSDFLHQT